jgi:hypothetical protein
LERVYIYTDESNDPHGGILSIAGLALTDHVWAVRNKLLKIEELSGKDSRDWHKTKEVKTRVRYLELVVEVEELAGRLFFQTHPHPVNSFDATVETLSNAILEFGAGRQCVTIHEGFTGATRLKLQKALRALEHNAVVDSGSIRNEPRVRLADSLAGFCRLMHSGSAKKGAYDGLDYETWILALGVPNC